MDATFASAKKKHEDHKCVVGIMAVCDREGVLVGVAIHSASPHEVTLVEPLLDACLMAEPPKRMIGDRAYDSDKLDAALAKRGIEMIASHRPHRKNRKPENKTQDGRQRRRYKRRWKIERQFAWLQNFRRTRTRDEWHADNYEGMVQIGCVILLLRHPMQIFLKPLIVIRDECALYGLPYFVFLATCCFAFVA